MGKGEEITGVHTTGDKKVPCSLGSAANKKGGFDFEEPIRIQNFAGFLITPMPDQQIALHWETPEVEIPVTQPHFLSDIDLVIEGERNRDGGVENPE